MNHEYINISGFGKNASYTSNLGQNFIKNKQMIIIAEKLFSVIECFISQNCSIMTLIYVYIRQLEIVVYSFYKMISLWTINSCMAYKF